MTRHDPDLVQDCRDDQYAACQRLHRELDTDRGLASTRAAVRSPTGCTATARTNLRGDTATTFHGPCSPAERALIKDEVHREAPDPTIRTAGETVKDTIDTADKTKTALGLAGLTAGTLTGNPGLAHTSTQLLL